MLGHFSTVTAARLLKKKTFTAFSDWCKVTITVHVIPIPLALYTNYHWDMNITLTTVWYRKRYRHYLPNNSKHGVNGERHPILPRTHCHWQMPSVSLFEFCTYGYERNNYIFALKMTNLIGRLFQLLHFAEVKSTKIYLQTHGRTFSVKTQLIVWHPCDLFHLMSYWSLHELYLHQPPR